MYDHTTLAYRRLQELYDDAAVRRSVPPQPHFPKCRVVLGGALVRWGERLARPLGPSVAHR